MGENPFRCKRLFIREIRTITTTFREQYWKNNDLPVDMERIIEKELHLEIIPQYGIKHATSIDAFLRSDLSGIIVDLEQYQDDEEWSLNRLRFSFAHEIGHFILHRNCYDDINFETTEDYCRFIENFPEKEYSDFEWQANEFAGSLLVPVPYLKEKLRIVTEKIQKMGLLELLDEYSDDILERVSKELCKPFGVSREVIERRVRVENLWPPC